MVKNQVLFRECEEALEKKGHIQELGQGIAIHKTDIMGDGCECVCECVSVCVCAEN